MITFRFILSLFCFKHVVTTMLRHLWFRPSLLSACLAFIFVVSLSSSVHTFMFIFFCLLLLQVFMIRLNSWCALSLFSQANSPRFTFHFVSVLAFVKQVLDQEVCFLSLSPSENLLKLGEGTFSALTRWPWPLSTISLFHALLVDSVWKILWVCDFTCLYT